MTAPQEKYNRRTRIRPTQKQRQLMTGLAAGILVAGSLLLAGAKLHSWTQSEPLPANQACKQYATDSVKALKANIDLQFGVAVPEGTPTPQAVAELGKTCDATIDKYEVVVGK